MKTLLVVADDFATVQPMLRQHCVRCHNADKQEGDVRLDDLSDADADLLTLAAELRPFARNLIIRIAEYAKGRELVAADYPIVESIVKQTQQNNFQLKEIVYRIATSELPTRR